MSLVGFFFFFFNDTATTEIYTLSLHDALPIWSGTNVPPCARAAPSRDQRTAPPRTRQRRTPSRSEEHTSELQSLAYLVCRLLLEKKKNKHHDEHTTAQLKHQITTMTTTLSSRT